MMVSSAVKIASSLLRAAVKMPYLCKLQPDPTAEHDPSSRGSYFIERDCGVSQAHRAQSYHVRAYRHARRQFYRQARTRARSQTHYIRIHPRLHPPVSPCAAQEESQAMTIFWTTAMSKRLQDLYAEATPVPPHRHSQRGIANIMSREFGILLTHNAIAGALFRFNVRRDRVSPIKRKERTAIVVDPPKPEPVPIAPPEPQPVADLVEPGYSLFELTDAMCRFPIDNTPLTRYCGAQVQDMRS